MKSISLIGLVALAGCSQDYDALEFRAQGTNLVATGTIDQSTPSTFQKALTDNPQVRTLILRYIDGSVDDEANLQFSRAVRAAALNTMVPSDGLIASGGTDLFLAGVERSIEAGACVGVHSWAGGFGKTGAGVPRSDSAHVPYLLYYEDMGIPAEFYWFTLEAAPADGMHWMTPIEVARYGMVTVDVGDLAGQDTCDERDAPSGS